MFISIKLGIKLTSQGFANSFNKDWAHWGSGGERTMPHASAAMGEGTEIT